MQALRASDRVKASVKEKTEAELLDHYQPAQGSSLTNLGVLCLGMQKHRAQLTTSPVIQFIKYDEHGEKVNKLVWDDHTQSRMELIEAVWRDVPDFRERYELPDGLYRQSVPAFDEIVVRDLLVNALVHRPYTQRGDIFLNLHPDRLEVVNPGLLPLGVTPQNVLHTTVRRNEHLARLFHDLKLMEREGSGFDKIFEVPLSQGRPAPELIETHDRVQVTVRRRILKPEVIDFIAKADQTFQLTQRVRIALGLLAQHDALTARELASVLELSSIDALQPWLKRLLERQLVQSAGRTQAKRYFVDPGLLRSFNFTGGTTLKRIEPHRLAARVIEDLQRYPNESTTSIDHKRCTVGDSRASQTPVFQDANHSQLDFHKLKGDPDNIGRHVADYIAGFSENIRKIFERFEFDKEVEKLEESNRLYQVESQFAVIDLHPRKVDNITMGLVFEDLIRRFNEASNVTYLSSRSKKGSIGAFLFFVAALGNRDPVRNGR